MRTTRSLPLNRRPTILDKNKITFLSYSKDEKNDYFRLGVESFLIAIYFVQDCNLRQKKNGN